MKKNNVAFEARTSRNFLKYRSSLREIARKNRHQETKAEALIWNNILKGKKLGYRFTRQKPIGRFIVDFYCSKLSLVIEIDGNSHDLKTERDKLRDRYLKQCGILTIRYNNEDIFSNIDKIKKDLREKIAILIPSLSREG